MAKVTTTRRVGGRRMVKRDIKILMNGKVGKVKNTEIMEINTQVATTESMERNLVDMMIHTNTMVTNMKDGKERKDINMDLKDTMIKDIKRR